jgi:translin
MDLEKVHQEIDSRFSKINTAREDALQRSRKTIQYCGKAIRSIHRDDFKAADELIAKAKAELDECENLLKNKLYSVYYAGFVQNAQKEYVEAISTYNLVKGNSLPDPTKLKVGYAEYLNGVGEAVGELRRHALDLVRKGNLERAEQILDVMDDIFYLLAAFDYPDAITGGLRRTTDIARSIMEKTRGDLTTAIRQRALKESIRQLQEKLK